MLFRSLDTGPVFGTVRVPIGPRATADELRHELVRVGTEQLVRCLTAPLGEPAPQVGEPLYAAKIRPDELRIDWSASLDAIVVTHEHEDHFGGVAKLARRNLAASVRRSTEVPTGCRVAERSVHRDAARSDCGAAGCDGSAAIEESGACRISTQVATRVRAMCFTEHLLCVLRLIQVRARIFPNPNPLAAQ